MQRRTYTSFSPRLLPKTHLAHQKTRQIFFPEAFWARFSKQPSPTEQTATLNPDMAFHEILIGSCSGILLLVFQLLPIYNWVVLDPLDQTTRVNWSRLKSPRNSKVSRKLQASWTKKNCPMKRNKLLFFSIG